MTFYSTNIQRSRFKIKLKPIKDQLKCYKLYNHSFKIIKKKKSCKLQLFLNYLRINDYSTIFFSTVPSLYKYNNTSPANCSAGTTS